jgi:hypothetical protein
VAFPVFHRRTGAVFFEQAVEIGHVVEAGAVANLALSVFIADYSTNRHNWDAENGL